MRLIAAFWQIFLFLSKVKLSIYLWRSFGDIPHTVWEAQRCSICRWRRQTGVVTRHGRCRPHVVRVQDWLDCWIVGLDPRLWTSKRKKENRKTCMKWKSHSKYETTAFVPGFPPWAFQAHRRCCAIRILCFLIGILYSGAGPVAKAIF